MVAGRQSPVPWEPSPAPPLSCDPGQVRKVSWACAAPRLADLSPAGEGGEAWARRRRPALGDPGRLGDTFASSLGAPRLGPGWPRALRGEGCGCAGALGGWGSLGGGGGGAEVGVGAGAGDRVGGAGPRPRRGVSARAGWRGPPEGCNAGAGDWGRGKCAVGGLAQPRSCAGEGAGGSDARLFAGTGRWEGTPTRARSWRGRWWARGMQGLEGRRGAWGSSEPREPW